MKQFLAMLGFSTISIMAMAQTNAPVDPLALCADYLKIVSQTASANASQDLINQCNQLVSKQANLESMKAKVLEKINMSASLQVQYYGENQGGIPVQSDIFDQASVICKNDFLAAYNSVDAYCKVDIKPEFNCKTTFRNVQFGFSADLKTIETIVFAQSSGCVKF